MSNVELEVELEVHQVSTFQLASVHITFCPAVFCDLPLNFNWPGFRNDCLIQTKFMFRNA